MAATRPIERNDDSADEWRYKWLCRRRYEAEYRGSLDRGASTGALAMQIAREYG